MMVTRVEIVAYGSRTPLGLHADSSAAACRAGIAAMRAHPYFVDADGDSLRAAYDPLLDVALTGPERLLALLEAALHEACAPLTALARPAQPIPLLLALPEVRPGFAIEDIEAIRHGIALLRGLPVDFVEVSLLARGHAGGLALLAQACERLRRGEISMALVGGVDSYFHPDTIEWLDANRQIVSSRARSAFVPGEGAAVCLLRAQPLLGEPGLAALGYVEAASTSREDRVIKSTQIGLGVGLTTVIAETLDQLETAALPIRSIYCDINGERYRGEEWGYVCLRLPLAFEDPTAYCAPADCWGDLGAASGPLFAMLASQAAQRGYAAAPRSLLWASSEGGLRAAAVINTSDVRGTDTLL